MQTLCEKLCVAWEKSGIPLAQLSAASGVPEATLRRLRTPGSGTNFETAAAVARALGVSLDELAGLERPAPAEPPAHEERYFPSSEDCAKRCPARAGMNATIALIREMYEARIAANKDLYERGIASSKKRERGLIAAIIVMGAFLLIYLYFDVRNGEWGFLRYAMEQLGLFDSANTGLVSL